MQINRLPALPAEITPLGRWLAAAQQLKDTLTIVGMNLLLLFGLLLFGLPLPGLVLYYLRWRLTRGQGSRTRAVWLWALGTVHEAGCALLFASASMHAELQEMADYLTWGYLLGLVISLTGLLTTALFAPAHPLPTAHENAV